MGRTLPFARLRLAGFADPGSSVLLLRLADCAASRHIARLRLAGFADPGFTGSAAPPGGLRSVTSHCSASASPASPDPGQIVFPRSSGYSCLHYCRHQYPELTGSRAAGATPSHGYGRLAMDVDDDKWFAANRARWDERVPIHVGSEFYDIDGFKAGRESLRPFEVEEVGDVVGKRLLHLQCHFGQDSLGWARHGASVTGLDFSAPGVEVANVLANDLGLDARFVCANVYDAVDVLDGQTFDIVYTGLGAINWLPDLERWAQVVAALVAPDGFLYLSEFHPFSWVFGDDDLSVVNPYFTDEPWVDTQSGTYADLEAHTEHNLSYERDHTLGSVVTKLINAGLRIELLHEHDHTLFPRWPFLVEQSDGTYRLPADTPSLPLMYSLRAAKDR